MKVWSTQEFSDFEQQQSSGVPLQLLPVHNWYRDQQA